MNNYNVMIRGLVENNDKAAARRTSSSGMQGLSVEPARQPQAEQVRLLVGQEDAYDSRPTASSTGQRLSAFINNNPVHERDRFYMAMLKPLGIEKGKEFKPDARQRAILEEAARLAT